MICSPMLHTLPGKGHSSWLREDGNSPLGDMPAEPASWLQNSFFESRRPGFRKGRTWPQCQGPPSQKVLLPVFSWRESSGGNICREGWGYRGHLFGSQTACWFSLSPHQSDIHADSHTEKSSNLQSDASLKMKSKQRCFAEKVT